MFDLGKFCCFSFVSSVHVPKSDFADFTLANDRQLNSSIIGQTDRVKSKETQRQNRQFLKI